MGESSSYPPTKINWLLKVNVSALKALSSTLKVAEVKKKLSTYMIT